MPRGGSRPGAGRPRGADAAAALEKIAREAEVVPVPGQRVLRPPLPQTPARKRAKERLEELLEIFIGAAAYHQPAIAAGGQPNPNADWDKFYQWSRLAMECADRVRPCQDPTFRALVVTMHGAASSADQQQQKLMAEADNVRRINDPVASSRVYHRIVSATRKTG